MWSFVLLVSLVSCAAWPAANHTRQEIEGFKAYLERTKEGDGLTLEERMVKNPLMNAWENSGRYQGDIVLMDEEANSVLRQYAGERNGQISPNIRWPSNTVIYEFSNEFTAAQRNAILAGMTTIERNTCIRFRQRNSADRNWSRITGRSDGCYAHVGHWPGFGAHTYNVALNTPGHGCFHPQVIIHEWLHVIGFQHMHQTHNRDTYVRINWNNIQTGLAFAFERYTTAVVDMLRLPYEYASNMHYGRHAFSRNGQPTIVPLFNDNNQMGQLTRVTPNDWLRVRRLYNCPGAWNAPDENEVFYEYPTEIFEDVPEEESA